MTGALEFIDKIITIYNDYVGGYAILAFLIPTGLYFIIKLKFLNITQLWHSFRIIAGKYDKAEDKGDVNHFKALTTALSATVGTGNIVGVALAIYFGGPGAIFWMWVTGFLGMILKYTECTLSHKFRHFNSDGSVSGGPMYYMQYGLKHILGKFAKVLAVIFAIAAVLCSLGTGNMAQSNSMTGIFHASYNIPEMVSIAGFTLQSKYITASIITAFVLLVIVGGIKRIAEVTSKLVPFMALLYILSALTVIFVMHEAVPDAFNLIFHDAFTGTAAAGGFVGSTFMMTLLWGVRRGLFSNEAGQGSAAIAHAAAKTEYSAREGLVASVGPLVDTLIICTLTALVIIVTGAWNSSTEEIAMTVEGMSRGLSKIGLSYLAKHIVAIGLILFAFSTIISWSYYGTRAVNYLFGEKFIKPYRYLYGLFVFLGAIWGIEMVWNFVDMVITFMTIPNLIALILLTPVVMSETRKYFSHMKKLKNK
ncbi:MAG: sodium:alanine symporter family protein [Bacteroidales bacterium]|nr:sodium:alanine symporter family protein [Bacteroidales bacterium]